MAFGRLGSVLGASSEHHGSPTLSGGDAGRQMVYCLGGSALSRDGCVEGGSGSSPSDPHTGTNAQAAPTHPITPQRRPQELTRSTGAAVRFRKSCLNLSLTSLWSLVLRPPSSIRGLLTDIKAGLSCFEVVWSPDGSRTFTGSAPCPERIALALTGWLFNLSKGRMAQVQVHPSSALSCHPLGLITSPTREAEGDAREGRRLPSPPPPTSWQATRGCP